MGRRRRRGYLLTFQRLERGLNMGGVDFLTLQIQLACLFKSFRFKRQELASGHGLFLDTLTIFSAQGRGFLCLCRVGSSSGICFPDTRPFSHELGTERLANKFPV